MPEHVKMDIHWVKWGVTVASHARAELNRVGLSLHTCAVLPAKSDSDVMFCLQRLPGINNRLITCVLILSIG